MILTRRRSAWVCAGRGWSRVIGERMRVNALISAHRALLAGAAVSEVAAAMGCSCTDLARAWWSWACGQVRVRDACARLPGVGMGQRDYEQVDALLVGGCQEKGSSDVPAESRGAPALAPESDLRQVDSSYLCGIEGCIHNQVLV